MQLLEQLKFDQHGLIPAVVQDVRTKEILMLAYMNRDSLNWTLENGKACYWSRSRQKLWVKGETSGHYQWIQSIRVDCDLDALVLEVEQIGPACHTGKYSCFYRDLEGNEVAAAQNPPGLPPASPAR